MQLVSYIIQHYFSIKFEDFTSKMIAALEIFQVIEGYNENDYKRLLWIEDNTNKDIMVSIYKLDRCVNPVKTSFRVTHNKATFIRNDAKPEDVEGGTITLEEDQIQYFMCKAIREVNDIVCRNIRDYGEEMKMPKFSESESFEISNVLGDGIDEIEHKKRKSKKNG